MPSDGWEEGKEGERETERSLHICTAQQGLAFSPGAWDASGMSKTLGVCVL